MQTKNLFLIILVFFTAACSQNEDPYQAYANGNYEIAKTKLVPLAEEGDVQAMTYLGAIYQMDQNYVEAIKHYTTAAEQNYAPAQYNLGVILHEGLGIKQNLSEAYGWFYLAIEQGHSKAEDQMHNMSSELTPNQIMKAKEWVKNQLKNQKQF